MVADVVSRAALESRRPAHPPNYLSLEIVGPKDLVREHLEIMSCVPVAMEVHRSPALEHSMTFPNFGFYPREVLRDSSLPSIIECSDIVFIDTNYAPLVREIWWICVNQIDALFRKFDHDLGAVTAKNCVAPRKHVRYTSRIDLAFLNYPD